ncbi:hypothetical protein KB879_01580 [Cupriavidus sp. KK10]|jgi:hypothetical protein|uniref:hypothetical protein n=1 Tax=Cupriavidus sp. KK10 TaxID=1478019 RepID=UPI001BA641F7|nr:hypothetical protein [Cupriavidus sp. KK10]QUN28691.1 hypothetical protein KB879_01580 [Cupriavidus sp. KK10]
MEDTKSILASKTFWGAAIVLVSTGLQLAGITDASGYANDAASILGAVLSIVGRVTASKAIVPPKS